VLVTAGLLLLLGLGLFVAGLLTGTTALYWTCVAACVVAAVLLLVATRRSGMPSADAVDPRGTTGTRPTRTPAAVAAGAPDAGIAPRSPGPPPAEDVEMTDLLLVVDLTDEVLVVDEHPRYHLAGCSDLAGRPTIPLPLDQARAGGFTPCGSCSPDRNLAQRARDRR
jgi:hypothetical protein